MDELRIDIETFSSVDLRTQGVYKYIKSLDFEILLFAYKLNGAPVKTLDLTAGETIPADIMAHLENSNIQKKAWNAAFERLCINQHFGLTIPVSQWHCTMVQASQLGLPLDLETCGDVLNVHTKKDKTGKALIRLFCIPNKTGKAKDAPRVRIYPKDRPDEWKAFIRYCGRDVEAEAAIGAKVAFVTQPLTERKLYILDQQINDRGILIDEKLITKAIELDKVNAAKILKEAALLTGLDNPKSVTQLKQWLVEEHDIVVHSLNKLAIPKILENTTSETVKRVLALRKEFSRTSIRKFQKMVGCIGEFGRARGLFQFYGANRTGRWAGRLIQLQNLIKNVIEAIECAREMVKDGDAELLQLVYGRIGYVLSQLTRTAFIAPIGRHFQISDFTAIEACVLSWLAGEKWRLKVFRTTGKIYEASAAAAFNIPIEQIDKKSPYRYKGKVMELALGYQGGVGAMMRMDTDEKIPVTEYKPLVKAWRKANPAIVQYWADIEAAAISAVRGVPASVRNVRFHKEGKTLFITLPSGRKLSYLGAQLIYNKYDKEAITYKGLNQTTRKWQSVDTYGGKLVENITQAIARDLLGEAMLRLDKAGHEIVMHVHDEVVIETGDRCMETAKADIERIMQQLPDWAEGLPLKAAGFQSKFYCKKD